MAGTAEKTDPKLWDRVKKQATDGEKGGRKGQWSARKAQLASAEYKKKGGGYKGSKAKDNHLSQWTKEEWGTKSGGASRATGERYLPRKAREKLSDEEYGRSTAAKRRDTAKGKQFSRQPTDVATKTAGVRETGTRSAKATAKRRPAAEAPKARNPVPKTSPPRAATGKTATRRTPQAANAPARKKAAAIRKAGPMKATARKPALRTPARKTASRKPTVRKPAAAGGKAVRKTVAAPRKAASGTARKPSAPRKATGTASPVRSTKGGSKR